MRNWVLTTLIRFAFAYLGNFVAFLHLNRADSWPSKTRSKPELVANLDKFPVNGIADGVYVCEAAAGFARNPAPRAAIAPKQPPQKARIGKLPPRKSKHLVLVTRLKTSVTWAKSTKLVTLTVKPFALGHNL
jgi:hypothetical protein